MPSTRAKAATRLETVHNARNPSMFRRKGYSYASMTQGGSPPAIADRRSDEPNPAHGRCTRRRGTVRVGECRRQPGESGPRRVAVRPDADRAEPADPLGGGVSA